MEVQGTAEREPFDRELLDELLDLGVAGCAELAVLQRDGPGLVTPPRLVLATGNQAKLAELTRILEAGQRRRGAGRPASSPARRTSPRPGPRSRRTRCSRPGPSPTFTGLPAVADDSGLCVDALNGMPGVLSARWSGRHGDDEANLRLVLGQLADVPDERRGAHFACTAALVLPSGREHLTEGIVSRPADPRAARPERVRLRPDLRAGRRRS